MNIQTIILNKREIEDIIQENEFSEFLGFKLFETQFTQSALHGIKKEINYSLNQFRHCWEGTYVFIFQDNSSFMYGLYKAENSKIYLVKSFMDTILSVVKFERKMLHT